MEKTESCFFFPPTYVKTTEHNCSGLTSAKENGILNKHSLFFLKTHFGKVFVIYRSVLEISEPQGPLYTKVDAASFHCSWLHSWWAAICHVYIHALSGLSYSLAFKCWPFNDDFRTIPGSMGTVPETRGKGEGLYHSEAAIRTAGRTKGYALPSSRVTLFHQGASPSFIDTYFVISHWHEPFFSP